MPLVGLANLLARAVPVALYAAIGSRMAAGEAGTTVGVLALAAACAPLVNWSAALLLARAWINGDDRQWGGTLGALALGAPLGAVILGGWVGWSETSLTLAALGCLAGLSAALVDCATTLLTATGRFTQAVRSQALLAGSGAIAILGVLAWPQLVVPLLLLHAFVNCAGIVLLVQRRLTCRVAFSTAATLTTIRFGLPLMVSAALVQPAVVLAITHADSLDEAERLALLLALNWLGLAMALPGLWNSARLHRLFGERAATSGSGAALGLAAAGMVAAWCGLLGQQAFSDALLPRPVPALLLVGAALPFALFQAMTSRQLANGRSGTVLLCNGGFALAVALAWAGCRLAPDPALVLAAGLVLAHAVRAGLAWLADGWVRR